MSSEISNRETLIIHQNIRSLRSNFDLFLVQMRKLENNPLIIVLTEIWILENEIDSYHIEGYSVHGNFNHNYRAGGTLVYISSEITFKTKTIVFISADCVHISCSYNNFEFQLLAAYRLQSNSPKIFLNELTLYLEEIFNINENNEVPFFFTGDINIDLFQNTRIIDDYKYLMNSFGFESLNTDYTHRSRFSNSLIDHLYLKSGKNRTKLNKINLIPEILHLDITDHSTIILKVEGLKRSNEEADTNYKKYA